MKTRERRQKNKKGKEKGNKKVLRFLLYFFLC